MRSQRAMRATIRVSTMRQSRMGNLHVEYLKVFQQQFMKRWALLDQVREFTSSDPQSGTRHLDEGLVRTPIHSQKDRGAGHSLPAEIPASIRWPSGVFAMTDITRCSGK